jgi:hypothetical protein
LKERIDKLPADLATPAMKEWAHHVRLDANEATREVEDFSEEDAKKLQVFTEMFLTYCIHSSGDAETSQRGGVLGWLIALLCLL